MKKGIIYRKTLRHFLFGSMMAAASVSIAAFLCIAVMRGSIIDVGQRLGMMAAQDSREALAEQRTDLMLRIVSNKALIIDLKLTLIYMDDETRGAVGAGMALDALEGRLLEAGIETGLSSFIINDMREVVVSNWFLIGSGDKITNDILPDETVDNILNKISGMERVLINGEVFFIAYHQLNILPWSVVFALNAEGATAPVVERERRIIDMTNDALKDMDRLIWIIIGIFGTVLLIILAWNIALAGRLAVRLTQPIHELIQGAGIIGSGNMDYRLEVNTGDEIETLAKTFNGMIDNIKQITMEKEHISTELSVAAKIQADMLPRAGSMNKHKINLFTAIRPAKEVGGDFYDFFMINEETLAVVIADVSGKGVPAALFMAITKTLIKNGAMSGLPPKLVFEKVNVALYENNDMGMFATVIMGYYHLPSGRFNFVNGGHNHPLIRQAGGEFNYVCNKPSPALAAFDTAVYEEHEIVFSTEDTLILYTDGVTEAINPAIEMFSEVRLRNVANKCGDADPDFIINEIMNELNNFADGEEQADDITLLVIKF